MNSFATRPSFAEGQILAAADLARLSTYPRAREERHNRFVHRWGIVTGLDLQTEPIKDSSGNDFARVFVSPGLAVDGEGRELLVVERIELDPDAFRNSIGSKIDPKASYPIFLQSEYRVTGPDPDRVGPCGETTGGGAVEEGHRIHYGAPGDETADQVAGPLSSGPTDDVAGEPWLILVGFVKWSAAADKFADIDRVAAAKLRPFIGINASVVAGNGGQVQLQAKNQAAPGDAIFQLLQTENGPELRFGSFKAPGQPLDALLTVNAKGDLETPGSLTGRRTGNSVQVQSGIAGDGVVLPLPPGVTPAQVDDGSVTVHVLVSPLIDPADAPGPPFTHAAMVQECWVDRDRRVHCRTCWVSLTAPIAPGASLNSVASPGPSAVSYLVAVATSEGGSS